MTGDPDGSILSETTMANSELTQYDRMNKQWSKWNGGYEYYVDNISRARISRDGSMYHCSVKTPTDLEATCDLFQELSNAVQWCEDEVKKHVTQWLQKTER